MKSFLKYTLATLVALFLFGIINLVIFGLFVSSFAALGKQAEVKAIPENAVLQLKIEGNVEERSADDFVSVFSAMNDRVPAAFSLASFRKAIKEAAKQPDNIKAVVIECGTFASSPASAQEIRSLIAEFKEATHIPVYAFSNAYTQSSYWIASVADSVFISPYGTLGLTGLSMSTTYCKAALDKLGVEMQVFKVGTFKSAVEPYILNEMSDANRLQLSRIANNIWKNIAADISEARSIEASVLDDYINQGRFIQDAAPAFEANLVDALFYSEQLDSFLREKIDPKYKYISLSDVPKSSATYQEDKIAVLYAVGEIDGAQGSGIVSDEIVEELDKLAENKKVKAVVLRVNSPGGSAAGSELMWYAAKRLADRKPLVISMGDYAASGGYYLSSAGDYIVADPTTLTGSIGIFGMLPNAEGVTKKLGLNFETVKTHDLSDFASVVRPATDSERAVFQNMVNQGYELFVKRCADGRGLSTDSIKTIAEGRVWTGEDALSIGLVDALGSIDDAIEKAAQLAELDNYSIVEYPKEKDLMTSIFEALSEMNNSSAMSLEQRVEMQLKSLSGIKAYMPYFINF